MSKSSSRRGAGKKKESVSAEIEEGAKKIEEGLKKEARKVEKKTSHPRPKPTGRVPVAMVSSRHGEAMVARLGRGFSLGEVSGSGLTPPLASRWGVRVDPRRRSVLQGNVESLRGWSSRAGISARAETEAKKVGEELKEIGEEAEREVVIVAKEAVKAEKRVKRGAKKAEKAVKAKVEKKARPKKKA